MIVVENVTKRYGAFTAVDNVSFTIGPGEIVGFLGPNGAGKSTVLKMLCTWIRPTAGKITIDGHDVVGDPLAVRRSLGYLTEHNALYENMRVDKLLNFVGKLRGLSGKTLNDRRDWVVDQCTLDEVLHKQVQECSKGFRQRIGVAAALIHDPRVILLDEPTHGLDPLQVVAFREFIRSLSKGRAILFSSHNLAEVASISERLLVINQGRLLEDAPLDELRRRSAAKGQELEHTVLDIVRHSGGSAGVGALDDGSRDP